ncbi:hypothetical protein ALDI51_45810 [Alicycliphilus denitrificans]|nr:hypothetical protein ALDI51_45810 [Alicycliphilus denitrificans]
MPATLLRVTTSTPAPKWGQAWLRIQCAPSMGSSLPPRDERGWRHASTDLGPAGAMVHEARRNGGLGETIDRAPIQQAGVGAWSMLSE